MGLFRFGELVVFVLYIGKIKKGIPFAGVNVVRGFVGYIGGSFKVLLGLGRGAVFIMGLR